MMTISDFLLILVVAPALEAFISSTKDGHCTASISSDSFWIKSLPSTNISSVQDSRSFIECCLKCVEDDSCTGVAFKQHDCYLLSGRTPLEPCAEDGTYLVMQHDADLKRHLLIRNTTRCNVYGICDCIPIGSMEDTAINCKFLFDKGIKKDNIYTTNPDGKKETEAFCDMYDGGGGWTVIQRRVDDSIDFYRSWDEYVAGFGNLSGNLWAGLDNIHRMTSEYNTELHIYLETFQGEHAYAHYDTFYLTGEPYYVLTVSGYTGTAGDSMTRQNGMKFTTKDRDNDLCYEGHFCVENLIHNCAKLYSGAWWHELCHNSNLNGLYLDGPHGSFANGINWRTWKGYHYSYKTVMMKIRRTDAKRLT